ncbi:G-type lectin S-receptor-like serine/threonine-protein kinase At4g27290 [Gastrolobium bilobum]|uniref:G-type lectin S-receptor-like serine/threonine-protein kinase At4g27290 n=1 Tax=Gastrolobium bilobum TaxID=150636 RepID=UPI002AAF3687|nr:G-type lectin S-receptor-like serine/threonine-protein kinase At4g27290 [Gastrolobium bilobum]
MGILPVMLVITIVILLFSSQISSAIDTITLFQSLPDGRTLVSKDGIFELGFFSPSSSTNRYVGIWYKNIPVRSVVWVANRDTPIKDNSSMLNISKEGNLVLLSQNGTVHWSTNATKKAFNATAQLLDSGNLVLRDEHDNNPESFLWQSFDYPSDTLLPGMKLGWNLKTNLNRHLTAWKNKEDPSMGDFTWGFVRSSNPEMVMWKGLTKYYRGGPWNGIQFSAAPSLKYDPMFDFKFVYNEDELYYTFSLKNKSVVSILVMNQTTYARERYTWIEEAKTWRMYSSTPRDYCDNYNLCGPFGNCAMGESPVCQCLRGFNPKSPQDWITMDWTQGCVISETWKCKEKDKDGFLKFINMKVPDTDKSWVNGSMTLEECKAKCWENCSCTAFANSDIRGEGIGCVLWFDDLLDLRRLPDAGQDLYVRVATSEIENQDAKDDLKKKVVVITSTVSSIIVMLLILTFIYRRRKTIKEKPWARQKNDESKEEDFDLPLFDLASIAHTTDDFSSDKKLGEGGFGPVYRGTLPDGQEIAVKRLSRTSGQGLKEFKNEVIFCAKLQHRNLVKVLGCCIQEDEKLLIYEYMSNKSLDYFLFDSTRSNLLDWSKRLYIITGIARGLLYLHQDSRLRIIHRDLKASNVLLDNDMNPKISDFGLARMCGGDQIEGNTSRVVGTYGYMAPEYAFDGLFSIKSDVFSFGILLLEIISGKKNKGLSYPNYNCNLIGHAWKLWKEGIPMKLIDSCMVESCILSEVLRCIHIGLLCVQHRPDDRPNMANVVVMLSSESTLPLPKEPGFLMEKGPIDGESSSEKHIFSSSNELTISVLDAR